MQKDVKMMDFCLQVMKLKLDELKEVIERDIFEFGEGNNILLGMKTIRPMSGGRAVASERGSKPDRRAKSSGAKRLTRAFEKALTKSGEYPR